MIASSMASHVDLSIWTAQGDYIYLEAHTPKKETFSASLLTRLHSLFKNKTFFALEPNSLVLPEWHWAGGLLLGTDLGLSITVSAKNVGKVCWEKL